MVPADHHRLFADDLHAAPLKHRVDASPQDFNRLFLFPVDGFEIDSSEFKALHKAALRCLLNLVKELCGMYVGFHRHTAPVCTGSAQLRFFKQDHPLPALCGAQRCHITGRASSDHGNAVLVSADRGFFGFMKQGFLFLPGASSRHRGLLRDFLALFSDISNDRHDRNDRSFRKVLPEKDSAGRCLDLHRDLIRLDLEKDIPLPDTVAHIRQPADDGPFLHIHAEFRHKNFFSHNIPQQTGIRSKSRSPIEREWHAHN